MDRTIADKQETILMEELIYFYKRYVNGVNFGDNGIEKPNFGKEFESHILDKYGVEKFIDWNLIFFGGYYLDQIIDEINEDTFDLAH